jgi:hypothetical protein
MGNIHAPLLAVVARSGAFSFWKYKKYYRFENI